MPGLAASFFLAWPSVPMEGVLERGHRVPRAYAPLGRETEAVRCGQWTPKA